MKTPQPENKLLAVLEGRVNAEERDYIEALIEGDAVAIASCRASFVAWRDAERLVRAELAKRQWQPIETAPKDGAVVDLWCYGGRVTNCRWSKATQQFHAWGGTILTEPTHWMPLPDPPTEKLSTGDNEGE